MSLKRCVLVVSLNSQTNRSNSLLDRSSRCDSLLKRLLRYQIDALALGLGNNS